MRLIPRSHRRWYRRPTRGFRGATHQEADLTSRLQSDLEYINGWTIWRDARILLATTMVLLHDRAF